MRAHLHSSKLYFKIVCVFLLTFCPPHTSAKEKQQKSADLRTLKLAQVVFRHGDRSPINEYPNDPYADVDKYWPNGLGQLSKKGMMQQYLLGEYLRWRYDGFINKIYNKNDIFIQSSNLDRTIMSAQSNLAGMYPPDSKERWNPELNWQPIPVHSLPTQYDNIMDFGKKCPRYRQEFQNVMQSEDIIKIKSDNQWIFDYLTENTGKDIETIEHITELYDTFFVQTQNKMPLPAFAAEVFPKSMKPLAEVHFRMLSYNEEMLKLRGGPLLKNMIWYMNLFRNVGISKADAKLYANGHLDDHLEAKYKKAKLYVYSGHDTTITALLNTLGVYNNIIPPYASCVMVELHGTKDDVASDYVKIFYLNDTKEYPYELQVPNCGNPCKLQSLKNLKNHLLIEDWENECQSISTDADDIPIKEQGSIHAEEQITVDHPNTVDYFTNSIKKFVLNF